MVELVHFVFDLDVRQLSWIDGELQILVTGEACPLYAYLT